MANGLWMCLLIAFLQISFISTDTNREDVAALSALRSLWQNTPKSWQTSDPCGNQWEGIGCQNGRVISITLSSVGLTGKLTGDILSLTELEILDLSYNKGLSGPLPPSIGSLSKLTYLILVGCSFSGPIPSQIGSLKQLVYLSLNSNSFSGEIPPEIGYLDNLYWLDLADNSLSGTIPVSSGSTPGLDMLIHHTKHFHFGKNNLSGTIPPQLFNSSMQLIHVLFENNQLIGSIPTTLGLVTSLEVVRFDRNSLSGPVPSNLNNLTSVSELHLSNNKLTGPLPNLTGMNVLNYVDLSNNSFDTSDVPRWFSSLQSLTTLVMEYLPIQGQLPQELFRIQQLQTLHLRNNRINGTLNIGTYFSPQLQSVDLQDNFITQFTTGGGYTNELILVGNPFCQGTDATSKYCTLPQQSTPSYSTGTQNCVPVPCPSDQKLSPTCSCSYPYVGTLVLRAPSFSDLGNSTHYVTLQNSLMASFTSQQVPVDSVSLSNPKMDATDYLEVSLEIFPANKLRFGLTDIVRIGFILSNQTFKPAKFGPYYFIGQEYSKFSESAGASKSVNLAAIIGASAGGSLLVLLLIAVGVYAYRQKRKVKTVTEQNRPFASWDPSKSSGSIPQLKGARWFSFDELKKSTNNFSEDNEIGSGGYGKVYRGILPSGQLIAIKRAQQGSMQGGLEFKTEIELLSRVHHKNLVGLLGFCFEQGEQMLVYEFIANGSLKESLTGKSGVRLDWRRRLRVALGSARGLAYLHELANPPIVHRDIKSNNILLDDRLNARVADFGLSKPMNDREKGHVTTQVKGTMGYLDPEYYMTQQLSEKSDVYSFGIVMLEIITARRPIERGRYIVREVRIAIDKKKDLYGLHELLDPAIGLGTSLGGFEKYVDLALRCVEESGSDRPTMSEAVKEIESIVQLAGMNPNADSASTSASYEGMSRGGTSRHPYNTDAFFDYSVGLPPSVKIEPK